MDLSSDSNVNNRKLTESLLSKNFLYPLFGELSKNNIAWYIGMHSKTSMDPTYVMLTLEFQGTVVSGIEFNIASITLTHGKNEFSFNKESDKLIDFLLKIGLLSAHQDMKSVS